jgi:hypothetical protein
VTKLVGVKTPEARRAVKRLSRYDFEPANTLHVRLAAAYGRYAGDQRVPVGITDSEEFRLLRKVIAPTVLRCRYVARYRCLIRSSIDDTVIIKKEVIVRTNERPALTRKFRIAGTGARRFRLIGYYDNHTKESHLMAKKDKGNTATVDPNEVEGLENLEDVEDLEDLEDTDFEEPETEDEEDDTSELSGMTLKALRAKAKEAGITGASKKSKEELITLLSASDEEEEEGDEDEETDDGLDALDRSALKARLKELDADAKVKKSESDDALRERIRAFATDESEDEEEDEDDGLDAMDRKQLKATMAERGLGKAKKSQSDDDLRAAIRAGASTPDAEPEKPKGKKGGGNNLPNRELPAGKHGADAIASAAGVSAREVRVFLRSNTEKYPKNAELGRYAFTQKQVEKIAKEIKAKKSK